MEGNCLCALSTKGEVSPLKNLLYQTRTTKNIERRLVRPNPLSASGGNPEREIIQDGLRENKS